VNAAEIKTVYNGMGISILSTSRGILTDKQARKQKVGGEVICNIFERTIKVKKDVSNRQETNTHPG
jgi:hypothetical protein